MKKILLITSLLISSTHIFANDVIQGKELHDSNCVSCHQSMMGGDGSGIYTREVKRIETYPALVKQVRRCRDSLGMPWPDEHVMDVVTYLNETFYHYQEQEQDQ